MSNHIFDAFPALQVAIEELPLQPALDLLLERFPGAITFSTSFSFEDQIITHMIADRDIALFTLDTGRLFQQTYNTWNATREWIGKNIQAYFPDAELLQQFVSTQGPDAFYQSVENRKKCCYIRKVIPLQNALAGKAVWITGLRAEHSPERQDLSVLEWDNNNRIIKYNPLLHWDNQQVRAYIRQHRIPYNVLHDQGYVSIGCAPCTRAIKEHEDFRAGRWWWENNSKKECGLHTR